MQDTHFELVTGYVYTAPDDMLDSRPGTLMLTDCIELCRRNVTCKAANFETGLCVLFASSAEEFPGMYVCCVLSATFRREILCRFNWARKSDE